MKNMIMTLLTGFIVFEFIEHVIFPLFWYIKNGKKRSVCGPTGMLGKVAEVKQWQKTEGQVFVKGELWRAVSDVPLLTGGRANIDGKAFQWLNLERENTGDIYNKRLGQVFHNVKVPALSLVQIWSGWRRLINQTGKNQKRESHEA
ncbi:MAG: hypothetical protein JRE64_22995 [Deltaproteobacteria bacterium]|nr:hypothetical protein [Deltaproteobacteria bacterium]